MHHATVVHRHRGPPCALDVERDRLAEIWHRSGGFTVVELHDLDAWAVATNVSLSAALVVMRRAGDAERGHVVGSP